MLLSDGSVTRHLHLATGVAATVEVLGMGRVAGGSTLPPPLPPGAELLAEPLLQRRVLLKHGPTGQPRVYAVSWWNEEAAAAAVGAKPDAPIWTSLAASRTELFRDIRSVTLGGCPALEAMLLGRAGELVARAGLDLGARVERPSWGDGHRPD
jgi:chorismate-pyruvate lyase